MSGWDFFRRVPELERSPDTGGLPPRRRVALSPGQSLTWLDISIAPGPIRAAVPIAQLCSMLLRHDSRLKRCPPVQESHPLEPTRCLWRISTLILILAWYWVG